MMEKRLLVFLRLSEVLDEKVEFQQVSDNPLSLPTTRTTSPPPFPDEQHPPNGGKQELCVVCTAKGRERVRQGVQVIEYPKGHQGT